MGADAQENKKCTHDDLIYKFKKLEVTGIWTTDELAHGSHLEDLLNAIFETKETDEVDNSIKFLNASYDIANMVIRLEYLNNKFDLLI